MIIVKKMIKYYNKNKFMDYQEVEKTKVSTFEESYRMLKNTKINFVENKKGISCYEEIYFTYWENSTHGKQYTKAFDPITKKARIYKPTTTR